MKNNAIKYINTKTNYGVETVDQVELKDFPNSREFYAEIKRLVQEYRIAGINAYSSQRCDKTWNN